MEKVVERIGKIGIVPVVKIDRADDATSLAEALCAGGIPCAEVTFRTGAAAQAIRIMKEKFPDMCVGAGRVLNAAQVDAASEAGAEFIVSPGFNIKTVKYCVRKNIPIVPGISTPGEIEQAMEQGLEAVNFFPAEQSGGLAKIKAMSAPYGQMKFMPTGGIGLKNLNSYLDFPKVIACGGSWMVPGELILEGKWEEVTRLCKESVKVMLGFKLAHVGINAQNEQEALKAARKFSLLIGEQCRITNNSVFAGDMVEVMKKPYLSANGHIGVRTNYIDRAVNYLQSIHGIEFDEQTSKKDEKDRLKAIYLKEEIGGFAVHLLQK